MFDSTSNSPVSPSNFGDFPLPERIADQYQFPLAYHDLEDGKRYYAVQDWIRGVAQSPEPRVFWAQMKRRFRTSQIRIDAECLKLPYKATDQKFYKVDYAAAETLFSMLSMMSKSTGIVSEILLGKPYQQGRASAGFVYLISADEIPKKYKIGCTKNVDRRIYQMQTVVPVTYRVLHLIRCSNMRQEEMRFHRLFHEKRLVGEWFLLDPSDIAYIQSIKSA
jgi:hypothetical protein